MKIVCYAVNGSGVGHLKRLTAIARQLRLISSKSAAPLEIYFLTSSEASHLLFDEGFASFKFPSREVLAKSGIETKGFTGLIKQWTAQTLKLLQPDLLLVDTFPAGYYDELTTENLSLCRATAVVHRLLKFDNLDKTAFYEALARYDSIIVPEESTEPILPPEIESKTEYFGAVVCREINELPERGEVRRRLHIEEKDFVVYLSAGGGGDREAEKRIRFFYDSLSNFPETKFVIGAGALYRGQRIYAPNIIWLTNENAFELMPAFDAAISAAGYNSFHELLLAGVPTVFVPQIKWADDQFRRACRASEAKAAILSEKMPDAPKLQNLIETLRDEKTRRLISQNAQNLVPANHASRIARRLFEKFLSF
jgi:UDP-N-acetylglucosamine--N-acetylmuramyl-(pentapeptide) pyrophosphoryl-undecaprenol N-acetylglucosamine transferase